METERCSLSARTALGLTIDCHKPREVGILWTLPNGERVWVYACAQHRNAIDPPSKVAKEVPRG